MLECLVFGRRAAEHINARLAEPCDEAQGGLPELESRPTVKRDFEADRREIQELMSEYCFVARTTKGMTVWPGG